MPPLNTDLYTVHEFWRSEYGRKHTHYVGSTLYSNSREANFLDEILSLISKVLKLRLCKCSQCDCVYDKNDIAKGMQVSPFCNQDICQTCPICIGSPFTPCECKRGLEQEGSGQ